MIPSSGYVSHFECVLKVPESAALSAHEQEVLEYNEILTSQPHYRPFVLAPRGTGEEVAGTPPPSNLSLVTLPTQSRAKTDTHSI